MAEKTDTKAKSGKAEQKPAKQEKAKKEEKQEKKGRPEEPLNEVLVRIFGYDIPGSRNLFAGLTRIKGVSWTISNATCLKLNMPKSTKIADLSKDDIMKIENFLKELPIPDYLKNRRNDVETGLTTHNYGTDLDMVRDFDIKRLKEIRSYRGLRHASRLPVRGQRTRSHFRNKGTSVGVRRKKDDKKE